MSHRRPGAGAVLSLLAAHRAVVPGVRGDPHVPGPAAAGFFRGLAGQRRPAAGPAGAGGSGGAADVGLCAHRPQDAQQGRGAAHLGLGGLLSGLGCDAQPAALTPGKYPEKSGFPLRT